MHILDANGVERASLHTDSANRVVLELRDASGMPCITLSVEQDGTAHLELGSRESNAGLAIGHSLSDGTGICMNHENGKFGVLLTVPPKTPARLMVCDPMGNVVWSQPSTTPPDR